MNKSNNSNSDPLMQKPSGVVYIYECITCGKRFKKTKMDNALKPHKDKNGYQCYGMGKFVETEVKIN